MEELRRIAVGNINEVECTKIHDLIDAVWLYKNKNDDSLLQKIIFPVDHFLNYKKIMIKTNAANSLRSGAQLMVPGIIKIDDNITKDELVLIYSEDNALVGIGISLVSSQEMKKMVHGQAVKTERIY
jgi:H/ACA ribonucleoprotein complex subunit 4